MLKNFFKVVLVYSSGKHFTTTRRTIKAKLWLYKKGLLRDKTL